MNLPSGGTNDKCLSRVQRCSLGMRIMRTRDRRFHIGAYRTHGWKEQLVKVWALVKERRRSGVPSGHGVNANRGNKRCSIPDSLQFE